LNRNKDTNKSEKNCKQEETAFITDIPVKIDGIKRIRTSKMAMETPGPSLNFEERALKS
jgi:hypothetical protein